MKPLNSRSVRQSLAGICLESSAPDLVLPNFTTVRRLLIKRPPLGMPALSVARDRLKYGMARARPANKLLAMHSA